MKARRSLFATVAAGVFYLFIAYGWYIIFLSRMELEDETASAGLVNNVLPPFINDFLNTEIHRPEQLQSPPESGYPVYQSLLDAVSIWSPDDPEPPMFFKETLQRFNYSDKLERSYAEKFRNAELPFKIYDIPDILKVSEKWSDNYLSLKMRDEVARVEKSKSNHFMYWNAKINQERYPVGFVPPTGVVDMKFEEWLKIARDADENRDNNATTHFYYMVGTSANDNLRSFISKDLPIFSTRRNNFFISNVYANKGIQCRFGMRGIIAEAHYDSGRNMVAMIKGAKRYILNPPRACQQLGIIADVKHPSYRHSVIDWSDVSEATSRGFASVDAVDTILQAGEMLYIPSYWFHYIVSLKYSIQCNSRSGPPPHKEGEKEILQCVGEPKKW